jgi:hypothetical protein
VEEALTARRSSSLVSSRHIDFREGETIDEASLKALIRNAAELNT